MKNPNWLYLHSRQGYSYSALRCKALRLGYPFTITQKEYAAIVKECWHGHCGRTEGIRLLLDTISQDDLGFSVGNTILVCERHLGARNLAYQCANTRDIIDHSAIKRRKRNKTKQI